jgi:hypothetical protein
LASRPRPTRCAARRASVRASSAVRRRPPGSGARTQAGIRSEDDHRQATAGGSRDDSARPRSCLPLAFRTAGRRRLRPAAASAQPRMSTAGLRMPGRFARRARARSGLALVRVRPRPGFACPAGSPGAHEPAVGSRWSGLVHGRALHARPVRPARTSPQWARAGPGSPLRVISLSASSGSGRRLAPPSHRCRDVRAAPEQASPGLRPARRSRG